MSRWWFKARYIETCNCDYGCPCNYTQIPTHAECDAVLGYEITEGKFDNVDLAGLNLGYAASWPGPIHKGNGHAVLVIDERATPDQRTAIETIGTGQAGPGGFFEVFASTMATPTTVVVAPVLFERTDRTGRLAFGDMAEAQVGPIITDMGGESTTRILDPGGFIFRDALVCSAQQAHAKTQDFEFAYRQSSAFISDVAYNV